ncbi:flagellar basal body P-ring protein FlgI [Pacificimonas sp. WHA3]|uniref:Flagellar P-ring protein n=1 Tax=Pacificimonas pallii TaxID=2827236 RepID=A0ABS6SF34_9SPHN|nr:flagellar basal body P-ring protein FlgI [Pacificimonas pallii]MBV7257018.1 flagellar basal body P-ring protein FlgI [Pacificimonas pallii]
MISRSRFISAVYLAALLTGFLAIVITAVTPAQAARVKDLGSFAGVRSNQLTGYGIVVGLAGTGDDNLAYTIESMKSTVSRFGLTLPDGVNPSVKNTAAVILTAEIPAFAKPGQTIDITVSALGKAKSLRGGTLILSPLMGADGQVYAMAQGNVVIAGLGAEGRDGSRIQVNVPSSGSIPGGATVERMVSSPLGSSAALVFNLHQADFSTAMNVSKTINNAFGDGTATPMDAVSIQVSAPAAVKDRVALIGMIESLQAERAAAAAKVIVNSRSGTVVIGQDVRITAAAVSHGSLIVRVDENLDASQPEPFSDGETVVLPDSEISIAETGGRAFVFEPGVSLADLVKAINDVGAAPSDLVAILEALKAAGAMTAELVVI